MDKIDYAHVAEALKVVAHPVRLKVIKVLKATELSVTEIQKRLGIKQSITSQHLNSMKNKGILKARREGNMVYYSVLNRNILKIIDCIQSCKK